LCDALRLQKKVGKSVRRLDELGKSSLKFALVSFWFWVRGIEDL
jgi:hypothetical protein